MYRAIADGMITAVLLTGSGASARSRAVRLPRCRTLSILLLIRRSRNVPDTWQFRRQQLFTAGIINHAVRNDLLPSAAHTAALRCHTEALPPLLQHTVSSPGAAPSAACRRKLQRNRQNAPASCRTGKMKRLPGRRAEHCPDSLKLKTAPSWTLRISPWHTKSTRIVIVDCPELPRNAHVCKVCRPSTYAELPFAILTEMTKISKILPFVYMKSSQIVVKIRRLTTRIFLIRSKAIMCKMP